MTHVQKMPAVLDEIRAFVAELSRHALAFDPGQVDEFERIREALAAQARGETKIPFKLDGQDLELSVAEVLAVARDIKAQIVYRDYLLVEQSDMIVSLTPQLSNGIPSISSGVERELDHALQIGLQVYVVWKPQTMPSPFIDVNATRVFQSVEEALAYLRERGIIKAA